MRDLAVAKQRQRRKLFKQSSKTTKDHAECQTLIVCAMPPRNDAYTSNNNLAIVKLQLEELHYFLLIVFSTYSSLKMEKR